jgi:3-methyladenine DNA glycosylase AlkD
MRKISNPPRLSELRRELAALANPERARNSAGFFKTGKGQYGEGDRFIGITVPVLRRMAHRYRHLRLGEIAKLLASRTHEHRLTALEILVAQDESGDTDSKQSIFDFYLRHTQQVNNWDLVDGSAPYIIGEHLRSRPREILYKLSKSRNVWERRMAMVATMPFIGAGELDDTFAIARLLLNDQHDLIHKAVGWMLREAGKHSTAALLKFLKQNYAAIPRTALRYAIERLPRTQRKRILAGEFK